MAVTFTNNAANQLQERIRLALLTDGLYKESISLQQSKISTIHGFGLELIERFSYETGSSPKPRQLTGSEKEGLARIERYVLLMPMSKDIFKLKHSLRVLALYRFAFGQPRQENLLGNLIHRDFSPKEIKQIKVLLVINLSSLTKTL